VKYTSLFLTFSLLCIHTSTSVRIIRTSLTYFLFFFFFICTIFCRPFLILFIIFASLFCSCLDFGFVYLSGPYLSLSLHLYVFPIMFVVYVFSSLFPCCPFFILTLSRFLSCWSFLSTLPLFLVAFVLALCSFFPCSSFCLTDSFVKLASFLSLVIHFDLLSFFFVLVLFVLHTFCLVLHPFALVLCSHVHSLTFAMFPCYSSLLLPCAPVIPSTFYY
jgi:hypothetical protein